MNDTSKSILLINAHPDPHSFNRALFDAYKAGLVAQGITPLEIHIGELNFNPNLNFGYRKRTTLEPDLLLAWEKIQQSSLLVWFHPVWWGGMPAVAKGFVDRLFLPGFAYKYRENSVWWDKLLTGKTAHIITTLDQPGWYYRWAFGRPSVNQLKKSILEFCGIQPVKVTYIGPIRNSSLARREAWLHKVKILGLETNPK